MEQSLSGEEAKLMTESSRGALGDFLRSRRERLIACLTWFFIPQGVRGRFFNTELKTRPQSTAWWEAHDIRGISAGQKSPHHPDKGLLRYEYATFQASDDPALKLVIYTPV